MSLSGRQLLDWARSSSDEGLQARLGRSATVIADSVERPALVAALLSAHAADDHRLVREVTRFEIAAVREARLGGCGDVLLGCCWLLFMSGETTDVDLIWEAKTLNFDTFNYLDGALLTPVSTEASIAYAAAHRLGELEEYLTDLDRTETAEIADDWRTGGYFGVLPDPADPVEALAAWIVS